MVLKRFGRHKSIKMLLLVCLLLAIGPTALAHLPRLVTEDGAVKVKDPEISQAFYALLEGRPAVYEIHAQQDFLLYVNLLVPDLPGIRTDISARVARVEEDGSEALLYFLDGEGNRWEKFYEPFAGDHYLMGPEFKKKVPAGFYRIKIISPQNTGKYVLSVGKQEEFTPSETLQTIKILPALKRDFFEKSPLTAYFNLVGLFMLILVVLLALSIYLIYRWGFNR